jgi:hypothetical protein
MEERKEVRFLAEMDPGFHHSFQIGYAAHEALKHNR